MARSAVATINAKGPSAAKLAGLKPADLMDLPLFPTADYFERPDDMVPGQKMTMRLDPGDPFFGQVYGYIAPRGQCILDLDGPESCWTMPPSPTSYAYAHQGETILADGTILATANIGGAGGHAPHEMGWRAVPRYYEDTSTQRARTRYAEDDFGLYGVGIGVWNLTWGDAVAMLASATSGDWRWVDELGAWDFMGSCFVNLPGLPLHAKSGTRVARRASATPLSDTAIVVTMNGSVNEHDTEVDMGAAADGSCNCKTAAEAAQTAGASGGSNAASSGEGGLSFTPTVGLSAEDVDARIASALEANNAAWEAKLGESLEPLSTRLSTVEEISLSVLDPA